MNDSIDYAALLFWIVIGIALTVFWFAVGYLIHDAIAGNPKPDSPHVVCNESKPRPHIGSAITCFSQK